jgi:hypothetical protein
MYMAQAVFEEVQAGLDEGYAFYAGLEKEIRPFREDGWLHLTTIEGGTGTRVVPESAAKAASW